MYSHMLQLYTYTCRIHIDAMNKGRVKDFFRKICTSHFIVRFACERELETEQNCNILTPTLMAISVVSPGLFNRRPRGLLPHLVTNGSPNTLGSWGPLLPGGGFLYHILSLTHLISNSLTSCLNELYNSSIAHSISHWIFGIACLIVIKRK